MDVLTTLKKLRYVESNPNYRDRSRRLILAMAPPRTRGEMLWGWLVTNIESGASLAMAGLCFFFIFAGFSLWKSLSPLGISQLDPAALRAEAQAIDIQIQLAGLEYEGSALPVGSTLPIAPPSPPSPPSAPPKSARPVPAPGEPREGENATPPAEETASTTASLSIDEVLLKLSQ